MGWETVTDDEGKEVEIYVDASLYGRIKSVINDYEGSNKEPIGSGVWYELFKLKEGTFLFGFGKSAVEKLYKSTDDYPNEVIDVEKWVVKGEERGKEIASFDNLSAGFQLWVKETKPVGGFLDADQARVIFTTYMGEQHGGFDAKTALSKKNSTSIPNDVHIASLGRYWGQNKTIPEHLVAFWAAGSGDELIKEFEEETDIGKELDAVFEASKLGKIEAEEAKEKIKAILADGVGKALNDPAWKENMEKHAEETLKQKEEWWAAHKQCILLGGLEKVSEWNKNYRAGIRSSDRLPYRGRIIPIEGEYQERFINELFMTNDANMYLSRDMPIDWYGYVYPKLRLSLVKEESGGLREWDITSLGGDSLVSEACVLSSDPNRDKKPFKKNKLLNSHVAIESFTYSMNGSDPSTARKDIQD